MKILLTGGSGMVGRNILEHERSSDYEIISPSRKQLNLLDQKSIDKILLIEKPDLIIHSAGIVGGIQANLANPVKFLFDNMQIGFNIIMSAKRHEVSKFMNLGSSCMYPRNAKNPLKEGLILKGELEPTNEGYAIAKIASTKLCEYISKEDNLFLYKTIIPCNLYGKYDKFELNNSHMIPAVIKKINDAKDKNVKSISIWGDGLARREFMYAGDFADFIYYALDFFQQMPQVINVGLGKDYSVNDYYTKIANVVGYQGKFSHDLTKPTGMQQKLIDNSKLKDFGWQHKTKLSEGISKTYHYYLNEVKR